MKDVLLIGGGIMSANLGAMLKRLAPDLRMVLYEAGEQFAQEATKSWNNAGTGHAGICELYFTPEISENGEVNIDKAITVFSQFHQSLQFWSYAVKEGMIDDPAEFIQAVPHLSFVKTEKQVAFLKARYRRLVQHHFFEQMEFTTDRKQVASWAPLLLDGRDDDVPLAATRMLAGTEVNFGKIAEKLIHWFAEQPDCSAHRRHRVTDLKEIPEGWEVRVKDLATGRSKVEKSRFVFIGAGGASLSLLQKAGVSECHSHAGFPIGGQWLVCKNPGLVKRHHAKVYGQSENGASPAMALPHLDSRLIDGERSILFGPFAMATTRFTRQSGSCLDLPFSLRLHNLGTFIRAGLGNIPVIRYLIQQSTQSVNDRLNTLRSFYPGAKREDWKLVDAGIRVQVMKKTNGEVTVHYDTEIISNQKQTIAALLGASPGASICVSIMLETIRRNFPELLESPEVRQRLDEMIPGHGRDISQADAADFYRSCSKNAARILKLI